MLPIQIRSANFCASFKSINFSKLGLRLSYYCNNYVVFCAGGFDLGAQTPNGLRQLATPFPYPNPSPPIADFWL